MAAAKERALKSAFNARVSALENDAIDRNRYDEAIIGMLQTRYDFVSIDGHVLLRALSHEKNEGVLPKDFLLSVEALGGANAELGSHIRVALSTLRLIWNSERPDLEKKACTGKLLECLARNRWNEIWDVLKVFAGFAKVEIQQKQAFGEYLQGWIRGHFLIPAQRATGQ